MKSTSKKLAAGLVIAGCTAFSQPVVARLNVEPVIIVGYGYNSNFWRSEEDKVAVGTTEIKPGVKVGYETGKTIIDFDFFLEGYMYNDYDTPPEGVSDADDDNYIGLFGDFSGVHQTTDRITLGLDETISLTRDPAASDDFYDSIDREKYLINRFSPNAYYDFGNRFGLEVRYINVYTDYLDNGEDSIQNEGDFKLFYNFTDDKAVFLSYDIWTRDYENNTSKYLSNRVKLNYEQQFNYFSFNIGGGYHNRNFNDDRFDDLDLFSWNISLTGQNPPLPDENPRSYMVLAISQDMNDAGSGNSYYTATKYEAEFGHIFLERIVTSVGGYVQQSDYEIYRGSTSGRDDTTYAVKGLVGYKFFRRGKVNFEIGYKDRDSNIAGRSYSDTYGMISVEFGMDFGVL